MKKSTSTTSRAGPHDRQVHQYDKILRENVEAVLPGLIKKLLGIHVVHTEEIPDDIQHTKERRPDVLKKVADSNGKTFVLHLEWQVADESDMAYRMAEYYIMLLRCYRLPVKQYVLYLGKGISHMADQLVTEQMRFNYRIIKLSAIDYRLFLRARNPEEKMLSILCQFEDDHHLKIVERIVKEVVATSESDLAKQRHLHQLRVLSNLRNLAPQIDTVMESVATWFKEENDFLFYRGKRKGEEKKAIEVVKALLLNTDHTIPEIAKLVNVPEAFVRKLKRSLKR